MKTDIDNEYAVVIGGVHRKVSELTGEQSLRANIELVLNNARIGAQLSKDLAALLTPIRRPPLSA